MVVVDDDPTVGRAVARILRAIHYKVLDVVETAGAAHAAIVGGRPDLVIMDVNLGSGMSGIDLAMEVLRVRDVPILFLSGEDDFAVSRLTGHEAVFAFLPKPIRTATLQATVQLVQSQHDAHARLQELQQLLAESQRIAAIGSFHFTLPATILWSDETYRLHGVTRDTFHPDAVSVVALVHPDDRATVASVHDPARHERRGSFEYRVGNRRLRARAEWSWHPDGSIDTIIGTVQDVTEQERALEANRAKTEFLAHMSHELRTPLNAVLGLSEAMLENIFGAVNPRQREALDTIHGSGKHLLDLINDVLEIARVESGKLAMEPEQVLLRPLIDEATTLVASQLGAKRQRLVIDLGPMLPPVDIDRRRIKQVLLNLLGNAAKFSPPETTLTVAASSDAAASTVRIAIADQGPGISPRDRERIFQPFVTLDPSTSRAHGGAGLGLALAKRYVELHGGTIALERNADGGSTFIVTLPISADYVGPVTQPYERLPGLPVFRFAGMVVVLAEDNEPTSLAIRAYLEGLGCRVRVAQDGLAALEAAAAADVAVVVIDVQLPLLDGLQVISRLRDRDRYVTPIIALTAHAMPGDEARCLAAGATLYMAKPVPLRTLADTIARLTLELR